MLKKTINIKMKYFISNVFNVFCRAIQELGLS